MPWWVLTGRPLIVGALLGSFLPLPAAAQRAPRGDRNLITAEEIQQNSANNAYDLVRSLRPSWLVRRTRSLTDPNAGQVAVYVDGMRMGSVDELRNIPTNQIREVRFVSAADATTRFGTDHPSGAIEVLTKR